MKTKQSLHISCVLLRQIELAGTACMVQLFERLAWGTLRNLEEPSFQWFYPGMLPAKSSHSNANIPNNHYPFPCPWTPSPPSLVHSYCFYLHTEYKQKKKCIHAFSQERRKGGDWRALALKVKCASCCDDQAPFLRPNSSPVTLRMKNNSGITPLSCQDFSRYCDHDHQDI